MRELNLDQLRTLVAITDLGTFSAAARALHLAQPTVSLHVSELESRLGTPLVVRGGRHVQPTPAGEVLVERARRLLRAADDAVDAVQRHVEGRTGRVRLGTSTGVLVYLLPQVLKAMEHAHPGIDVEVNILGSADTVERLGQGTLDVGLVATPRPPQRGLVMTHWRSDPMMAFVPQSWPAPKRITPQWLASRPLIFNDATTHMHRLTMQWFAEAGLTPRARIELNFTEAMKSLVAAGYGAALLPLEQTGKPLIPQGVQVIPLRPTLTRHTAVVHRPAAMVDGATRKLLQTLMQFRQA
ncbi:LysR family transcriptional regulator [Polaromonas sp. SM01]|uniref:LysR family transcriptional regulator n=1 Tax=Polaromonas sp. SM01 TaxID=3085630 RepID=UPI0029817A14|nr:LysR family transcriptional regulator [Polaromonas sp. SM01]MDW5443268.1 LysR family transcriptional regulator [Polaromonas sp. SM01]